MPSNIEIKTRLALGREKAEAVAKVIGSLHETLHQIDTFFPCANGRMKLRVESGSRSRSCLITYHRSDVAGPKMSEYTLCPVSHPDLLLTCLSSALGVKGVVEKERVVYLAQSGCGTLTARIHLDLVKNLGPFLEFEVIIPEEGEESLIKLGQDFAIQLMDKFEVKQEDLVQGAYMDHLLLK